MFSNNNTSPFNVLHFKLICFPSIQSWQHLLSIPLALLLVLAIVANITILVVIQREQQLHKPLYYFIGMLAVLDLVLCLTGTPKTLGILFFGLKTIGLSACFTQMYFMNSFLGMESAMFLCMASDRYTAICNPLRYPSVITNTFVKKALVFILLRNSLLLLPLPLLASRLHYCSRDIIEHCTCATVAVTSLACGGGMVNAIYQMVIAFILLGGDLILILLSYCLILWAILKLQTKGAAAKAFSTCTSHLILISFFYTLRLVLIFTNKLEKVIPPDIPIIFNVLHLLLPPALNPIVYGVRMKEIKEGIVKMLRA